MEFGTGAHSAFWRLSIGDAAPHQTVLYSREDDEVGVRLTSDDERGVQLILHGDPDVAAACLPELRMLDRPDRTLASVPIREAMGEDDLEFFGPEWGFNWDFYYATEPLPSVPCSDSVRLFTQGSAEFEERRDEIRAALVASNPITDAINHFDVLDWFVAIGDDGGVAAVMGTETRGNTAAYHGLGTVPAYRGQGFGAGTMVGAVNLSLESHDAIEFGMWSWNDKARRLYERIGLEYGGQNVVGRREPFPDLRGE